MTVIYRVTAIYRSALHKIYKATENFGKLSGDRNIQGRYLQVGCISDRPLSGSSTQDCFQQ